MLRNFQPALKAAGKFPGAQDSHNLPLVQAVAEANVRLTVESVTKRSSVLKALVDAKELKVAGAMHDLATGKITWLS